MTVQTEVLDQAAARVASSAQTIGEICAALSLSARIRPSADGELLPALESVRDDLRAATHALVKVGATLPTRDSAPPALDALTALVKADASRPQAEALLDALRRAMPYAEALDDKHGRSCWSDDLGDVIGKLTLQIHGPDCGGRE